MTDASVGSAIREGSTRRATRRVSCLFMMNRKAKVPLPFHSDLGRPASVVVAGGNLRFLNQAADPIRSEPTALTRPVGIDGGLVGPFGQLNLFNARRNA